MTFSLVWRLPRTALTAAIRREGDRLDLYPRLLMRARELLNDLGCANDVTVELVDVLRRHPKLFMDPSADSMALELGCVASSTASTRASMRSSSFNPTGRQRTTVLGDMH